MAEKGRYLQAALDCANEMRAELGRPPVKHLYPGVRRKSTSCAITNTVYDDDISRDEYWVSTGCNISADKRKGPYKSVTVNLTIDAAQFVRKFDQGKYPRLTLKGPDDD